ncbi:hypothetical protein HU200_065958 [Digitaria exilis]|uniref:KIB1-4 beta-propeller domain-containing protein n=1 Tax=Digitaria exilis TaxID=1010633 RepID=A0A835A8I5_9POAL|nr:hypothetical protein HU200_065958 [Digitaria exilis]
MVFGLKWLLELVDGIKLRDLSGYGEPKAVLGLFYPVDPHTVPAPSSSHSLLGPTRSHLLLADTTHRLLLLNPLTGAQLPLPDSPFPTFSPAIQGYLVPAAADDDSPAPVVRCTTPGSSSSTSILLLRVNRQRSLWIEMVGRRCRCRTSSPRTCTTTGSYSCATTAATSRYSTRPSPPLPPGVPQRRDVFKCTAFVPSGDELLCVIRYFASDGLVELREGCGSGLEVYRLEMGIEKEDQSLQSRWVRMRSIGDHDRILFIGLFQGFSFSAANFPGFKGDCIYFFKLERDTRSCIYRFSLEDGRTEELPGPWMHACTWFLPSLT